MANEQRNEQWRGWYGRNKGDVNARRRERYKADKAYRDKQIANSRNQRRKDQRTYDPQIDCIYIEGVQCHRIAGAASMIGRTAQTIRAWEAKGWIPEMEGQRVYTDHQIWLMTLLSGAIDEFRYSPDRRGAVERAVEKLMMEWENGSED